MSFGRWAAVQLGRWAGSGTIAHCRALSGAPLASSTRRRPRQRRSRACGRSSSSPRASSARPCRTVSPSPPPPPPPPCPPRVRTRSRRNPTSATGRRVRACCRAHARPSPPLAQVRTGSVRPPPGERPRRPRRPRRARRHAPAHRPPHAPQLRRAPGERPPPAPAGDERLCRGGGRRGRAVVEEWRARGAGCTFRARSIPTAPRFHPPPPIGVRPAGTTYTPASRQAHAHAHAHAHVHAHVHVVCMCMHMTCCMSTRVGTHQALAVHGQRRRHGPQSRAELGRKPCGRRSSLLLLLRRPRCRRRPRRRLRPRWLRLQPLDLFLQPLLLTGQERAALLRRLPAVARLSRRWEECAARAVVAGRGSITGTGSSTHEGIAPPARRQVKSPARAALRLRSSTIQPLPLQKTVQPLSARRMARSSCDYSEQKETSLRTRRERWAEAWLGWMPGWAWAAVWTRMVTVRACAAAAGGAGQSAEGSPACRSRRVCQAPRRGAARSRGVAEPHENSCPFSSRFGGRKPNRLAVTIRMPQPTDQPVQCHHLPAAPALPALPASGSTPAA